MLVAAVQISESCDLTSCFSQCLHSPICLCAEPAVVAVPGPSAPAVALPGSLSVRFAAGMCTGAWTWAWSPVPDGTAITPHNPFSSHCHDHQEPLPTQGPNAATLLPQQFCSCSVTSSSSIFFPSHFCPSHLRSDISVLVLPEKNPPQLNQLPQCCTLKEISVVMVNPWVMTGSSSAVRPFQQSSSTQRQPDSSTCRYISTEELPASCPAGTQHRKKGKSFRNRYNLSNNN